MRSRPQRSSVKLRHVRTWIAARRAHGAAYDDAFRSVDGLALVDRSEGWNGAIYTVRVLEGRREALRAHLREAGVETAVYYETPLHRQPALSHLKLAPGAFPNSELAAAEVLSLPIFPELTVEQREHVVAAVLAFFR